MLTARFIFDGANFTGAKIYSNGKKQHPPVLTSTGDGMTFSSSTTFLMNMDAASATEGHITGDGPITINGTFEWRGGRIYGAGDFIVNGTFLYAATINNLINERTLTLNGDSYWTGIKRMDFENGATVINGAGATFHHQGNTSWSVATEAGTGSFINNGTLHKRFRRWNWNLQSGCNE
ncbi:MAG: hypothetical protein R3C26_23685 [Calditrichia bacterium]